MTELRDIVTEYADAINAQLPSGSPLRAVLAQRSRAYGTVAGALETYMSDLEHERSVRASFRALVNAINAPRDEAERLANQLIRLAREISHGRYIATHP
jgi:hypothetical protein